jgi:hypothetical protein
MINPQSQAKQPVAPHKNDSPEMMRVAAWYRGNYG